MKFFLYLVILFLSSPHVIAGGASKSDDDIKNIEKLIQPKLTQSSLQIPGAIVFVKSGAFSPTCALIYQDQSTIDFIGPDNNELFPACRNVDRSTIFSWKGFDFIVFSISVEDPRAVHSNYFQLLYRSEKVFRRCKNNVELSDVISTIYSGDAVASARKALQGHGCVR